MPLYLVTSSKNNRWNTAFFPDGIFDLGITITFENMVGVVCLFDWLIAWLILKAKNKIEAWELTDY